MRRTFIGLALSASIFIAGACKDASVDPEENELITTVQLEFTNGSSVQRFSWKDPDGDGGVAPVIDKISLLPNTAYTLKVFFLDESKSPAEDITAEVAEESDEHLVIYSLTPASLATYSYGDKDASNLPVGLTGSFTTQSAGTGTLKVQLRHQPPVNGVKAKNGTAGPGSDDVNVDFSIEVK